ncbi:MAG: alanine--tRNA ligase [Solirubrobacteraceae bacterium]
MTSDEIRETFLEFFVERNHLRLPSGSLVPSVHDPSVLLTTAGMQPLVPYFLGREPAPHHRLTSCQKVFRTVDIENVGDTTRHLTFFEMLGNFSIGDYFKQGAIEQAWEFSLRALGFEPDKIWITVFAGDEALDLGPDEEAIEAWLAVGVPRERIVECPRSENFWQAGATGPCGPCSELYFDRGVEFGSPDDLPGGENERFLEYWNLVFMQYAQDPVDHLEPLPTQNIDTGLGLNRMALIQQGTPTIFETDQFKPLVQLGEELSGRRYGEEVATDRALRILADHTRGMTFLVADGVVPSNEDRCYVLRRIMRRAIQQGRSLGIAPGFLPRYAERVEELMGGAYPELETQRDAVHGWLAAEEEGFGRTLEQGSGLLADLIIRARESGAEGIAAEDAFRLHDTYGFPIDLTLELVAAEGLGVDGQGFELLMDDQRTRARAGAGRSAVAQDSTRGAAERLVAGAGFATDFTGYAATEQETTVGALGEDGGRVLAKLVESPFYAAGGGQVSDSGWVECASGDCRARVSEVFRVGDDQVVALEPERGELRAGEAVHARVDRAARHATECNHTATHLLHAVLRERLGGHVRQAGSAVRPDKLRFDFTHGHALSPEDVRAVEDEVNARIAHNDPVRALSTTLDEARRLGAMALFGEKYGDVVRMVEIGDGSFSRELCGGTHVRSTAEIGAFRVLTEGSSAAKVRRIEALTGPGAIDLLRRHDTVLSEAGVRLKVPPERVLEALDEREKRRRELEEAARRGPAAATNGAVDLEALAGRATDVAGATVLVEAVEVPTPDGLLELVDRLKGPLGEAAVVLGTVIEGRVHLVVGLHKSLIERGVHAGAVVKAAAEVAGGGGGGRDSLARAGGRDPEKLPDALVAARTAIEAVLVT